MWAILGAWHCMHGRGGVLPRLKSINTFFSKAPMLRAFWLTNNVVQILAQRMFDLLAADWVKNTCSGSAVPSLKH